MNGEPKSENMKREQVGEYFLTTALWDSGFGRSYETGVRFQGDFKLLQHRRCSWEMAHEYVKKQILDGTAYHDLIAWGDAE